MPKPGRVVVVPGDVPRVIDSHRLGIAARAVVDQGKSAFVVQDAVDPAAPGAPMPHDDSRIVDTEIANHGAAFAAEEGVVDRPNPASEQEPRHRFSGGYDHSNDVAGGVDSFRRSVHSRVVYLGELALAEQKTV